MTGHSNAPPGARTPEVCLPAHLRKRNLRPLEAIEYLDLVHGITIKESTLATWRCRGGGPPFLKFNRSPLYPRDLLDAWADEKLGAPIFSTSEV